MNCCARLAAHLPAYYHSCCMGENSSIPLFFSVDSSRLKSFEFLIVCNPDRRSMYSIHTKRINFNFLNNEILWLVPLISTHRKRLENVHLETGNVNGFYTLAEQLRNFTSNFLNVSELTEFPSL